MSKKQVMHKINDNLVTVGKLIGEGGSSCVYECSIDNKDGEYAIKIMKNSENSNKNTRNQKEIDFQKKANSGLIVPSILDGVTEDGKLYYVMPLYTKTLRHLMKEKGTNKEKLKWFLDLCESVKFAHSQGIIHRDIKPENVMFDGTKVFLGDFGIARFENSDLTNTDDRLANFNYHAPEQKKDSDKKIGAWTDIYALGLILNELFTGTLPIGEKTKKIGHVSPVFRFLDDIVHGMLMSDVDNRENNVQDIINKIEFHYFKMEKDYEIWSPIDDIPEEIGAQTGEIILRHIYEDFILADNLLDDKKTDWQKINGNYHMNFGYSVEGLFDTILLLKILEFVKGKFEYEANVYAGGHFYQPLNCSGDDKVIFENFSKIINELNTIDRLYFKNIKGSCLKHFHSLCDYHAKEVLEKIENITKSCKQNLLDAPILWIAGYIQDSLEIIKETIHPVKFELKDWVTIRWNRHSLNFEEDEIYLEDEEYYKDLKKPETDIRCAVISELKNLFKNLTVDIVNDGYELYFTIDEWKKYEELCYSQIDETIRERYVLNGDIEDLCKNVEIAGKYALLKLSKFDICNVLSEVLFKKIPVDKIQSNKLLS